MLVEVEEVLLLDKELVVRALGVMGVQLMLLQELIIVEEGEEVIMTEVLMEQKGEPVL